MAKTVDIDEAAVQFAELIERARRGEEIILTEAGEPRARLCPLEPPPPRKPGRFRGKIRLEARFWEPLPPEELAGWEEGPIEPEQ
ncbi:MAG: type II toxin-antitoxin system Phd/YefM family antitoxin [Myxococcales bacterium]